MVSSSKRGPKKEKKKLSRFRFRFGFELIQKSQLQPDSHGVLQQYIFLVLSFNRVNA